MAGDNNKPVSFNRRSAYKIERAVNRVNGRSHIAAPPAKKPRHVVAKAGLTQVAVTSSVAAATWDKATKKKKNAKLTYPIIYQDSDGDDTFDKNTTVDCKNGMATAVTIPDTKWRVGYVVSGILQNVDCTDLDLPDNYNS
jgi:hypothetical protein